MSYFPKKYLVVGENCKTKIAIFNNQKIVVVPFGKTFDKKPSVQITMADAANAPAWKASSSKSKCTVRTQSKWTGEVELQITERE